MDATRSLSLHAPSLPDPVVEAPLFDEASLRRIQACVTACEGLTTEELEAGVIEQMRHALIQVVPLLQDAERRRSLSRAEPVAVST